MQSKIFSCGDSSKEVVVANRKEGPKDIFTREALSEYVHEEFIKSLPSSEIKELPTFYMYSVGFLVHATTFSLFLYFFITSYSAAISEKFLSLSDNAGVCNDVLSSPSATLLADYHGYWEGETNFSYSATIYNFEMNNWATNYSNYQYVMGVMLGEQSLQVVGQEALTKNLASNLLAWMSYSGIYVSENNEEQKFTMNGDPSVIFDRKYQRGSIGNYFGDCDASSTTTFNSGTSIISITYNYAEFISNPNCSGTINLEDMGYLPEFDGDYFSLSYDVRSLASAVAVNQQVQYPDNFWFINGTLTNYTYYSATAGTNLTYIMGQGFDDRYPGMDPLLCGGAPRDYVAGPPFCGFLINNKVMALPLFESYGADDSFPTYCDCLDGTGQTANCNIFNFLSGLLFFPVPSVNTSSSYNQEYAFFELLQTYQPVNISKLAYSAMFAGANVDKTSTASYFNSAAYRAEAYDWCAMSTGNCSILAINSVDTLNTAVNSYYYQLPNGSCTDSFYTPYFNRLVENPPVALTEPYFECRDTVTSALVAAAGISTGTTAMLVPFIILLFVNLVVFTNRRLEMFNYRLYTKEQRERLLDLLSLQLMLSRDKKVGPACVGGGNSSDADTYPTTILGEIMSELSENVADSNAYVALVGSQSGVHGLEESLAPGGRVLTKSTVDAVDNSPVDKPNQNPLHHDVTSVSGRAVATTIKNSDSDYDDVVGTEMMRWDIRSESRDSTIAATNATMAGAKIRDMDVDVETGVVRDKVIGKSTNSSRCNSTSQTAPAVVAAASAGVVTEVAVTYTGAYTGESTLRVHLLSSDMAVLTVPGFSFTASTDKQKGSKTAWSTAVCSMLPPTLCPRDAIVQTVVLEDSTGGVALGLVKLTVDGVLRIQGPVRTPLGAAAAGEKYSVCKLSISYELSKNNKCVE